MRRSGKTTRAIDTAVQKLFELGKIYVPTLNILNSSEKDIQKICDFVQLDPNIEIGHAQRFFRDTLLWRLHTEHKGQVTLEGNWIKLKDYDNRD